MIGHSGPSLSALLIDLTGAFSHPAERRAGVSFPADLTALWAEALRDAADMARTLESQVAALTVQRDAGIERIGALVYAMDQMRQHLPAHYRTGAALPASNVIDMAEAFRREQARRRPRPVDCQGDGA